MIIIGIDFHPEFQQIACVDTESGEFEERRLQHCDEAERFYRELAARGVGVRVRMEASGHGRWLERLLKDLQFELWIGDAAEIRTRQVGKAEDREPWLHTAPTSARPKWRSSLSARVLKRA